MLECENPNDYRTVRNWPANKGLRGAIILRFSTATKSWSLIDNIGPKVLNSGLSVIPILETLELVRGWENLILIDVPSEQVADCVPLYPERMLSDCASECARFLEESGVNLDDAIAFLAWYTKLSVRLWVG